MTLGTAVLVLVLALIGIVLAHKYASSDRKRESVKKITKRIGSMVSGFIISVALILSE